MENIDGGHVQPYRRWRDLAVSDVLCLLEVSPVNADAEGPGHTLHPLEIGCAANLLAYVPEQGVELGDAADRCLHALAVLVHCQAFFACARAAWMASGLSTAT